MAVPPDPLIYLVGVGPGHPGLLTLRAVECLGRADLVLYDKLVPSRLLEHAPQGAERTCVTELGRGQPERHQEVVRRMVAAARQGKCVVRLKGGDPFLFGRGAEEAEALRQAGVAFEVVPGVPASLAAGALAGIPLTHLPLANAVALIGGREDPGRKPEDWQALARFPGTLVISRGLSNLARIRKALLGYGKDPATPAAVIHWGPLGEQQTIVAPLGGLPEAVQAAGLTAPAQIIIGPVVALRAQLAWFEQRPLFGKRVLVTRPRKQAGDLVGRLEELGAVVQVLPAVDILPVTDWGPVDRALASLASYQWLVFTSANGVQALLGRLLETGRDLRALGSLQLAAIGPATAEALRTFHLAPDLVPGEFRSEALAAALQEKVAGQRVLLARADRGRDLLRQELARVAQVDQVAVYRQVDAIEPRSEGLECLRRGEIDYVTLTSSNIARSLGRALDEHCRGRLERGEVKLVSISPVTSEAVRELGLPVAAEAREYTMAGVVEALVGLAGGPGQR